MIEQEGVIKFRLEHEHGAIPPGSYHNLVGWREVLRRLELVGCDSSRYDGAGFGNLSVRVAKGFVITGSQTGSAERLSANEHLAFVSAVQPNSNTVASRGPCLPSSEAMTHGALYDAFEAVKAVFHVHCPELWHGQLPRTSGDVAYGTPAMAASVLELLGMGATHGIFAMGGHEDGVIAFGRTPDEAGGILCRALAGVCAGA